ncbi:MAG TPA: rRNA maturation RNase YbeY [Verrucomicrobiae bacterium]|nr:rRNA maturation RNase YbeY [Verrucomicrobiae bacterium]
MSGELRLFNRQRVKPLNRPQLLQMIRLVLTDLLHLNEFDLAVHLINASEMARLNETWLKHAGSTDVITLDYADSVAEKARVQPEKPSIAGEIFVCVEVVLHQARRFRVRWQVELARYIIHGLLHLQGYNDQNSAARRKMKRQENRLLKEVSQRFSLRKLERNPMLSP